ncbi:MAG TPA: 3'-5' exonuclease, partial [Roseiarcus sp.]|nr:3'-5' exonuclease [Roseiarcus sp.]
SEIPHDELAQLVLEESGYLDMWKAERTPDAVGRLDNLKELVRSMGEFPDLAAFLEHVSLVMDAEGAQEGERVSIMTLHAAKGLEFEIVYLPGWEEGLFPNQRALDDNGRAGLEEERRLAYVGLTRARSEAKIYHAANRRVRGLWQSSLPSRFITELPEAHVTLEETPGATTFGGYGRSPFEAGPLAQNSRYETPGWRRAEERSRRTEASSGGLSFGRTIEGQAQRRQSDHVSFEAGARIFHLKFGPGTVVAVDGQKLTVDFDHAGRKLVMESFVQAER